MKINQVVNESPQLCPECGGPAFSDLMLAEKQDACYNKVKSRYKVWPSAYASGALVQCRKKGAANWGNKSKNESVEESLADEFAAMARARGMNVRVHGTPDEERARSQQILAQRAKERDAAAAQAAADDVKILPELKAEYDALFKKYNSLGGRNWQYADREQNLTDSEREARDIEPKLNQLAGRIARAEKSQGVAEGSGLDKFRQRVNSQGFTDSPEERNADRLERKRRHQDALNRISDIGGGSSDEERAHQAQQRMARDEYKLDRLKRNDDDWENTFDMMRDRMNRYQWSSQRDVDPEQLAAISNIKYEPRKKNEDVQAKTDDKLLAYYAQRKAEKEKQKQQGVAEGSSPFGNKCAGLRANNWSRDVKCRSVRGQRSNWRNCSVGNNSSRD